MVVNKWTEFKYVHFCKFIFYFERERERERETISRGGAERRRDRIPSRLRTISTEPHMGLKLRNREIMTQVKIKSWTFN